MSDSFAKFWDTYPKKTAKQAALKAWNKLKPDAALIETIIAAVRKQREWDQWKRGIIPHPGTWLNGRRWEDQLPETNGDRGFQPPVYFGNVEPMEFNRKERPE